MFFFFRKKPRGRRDPDITVEVDRYHPYGPFVHSRWTVQVCLMQFIL